jgi:hypothetical protein
MQQAVPTKHQVRDYMQSRVTQKTPPPPIEEVRRQLGWGLVASGKADPQR